MKFEYLYNRLLRREAWKAALQAEKNPTQLRALRAQTAQAIFFHYESIIQRTGEIRKAPVSDASLDCLLEIDSRIEQLRQLLPYANRGQQRLIADAECTAAFARSLVPSLPAGKKATEVTYYSVFIPTLNGHFYYLGIQKYQTGDVVAIPFGGENKMIYGVVKEVFCQDYWKMPLPLWKMKYIDSKAPQAIAEEYRRHGAAYH